MKYRRKIQIVGGSTYTVSLPKEWVKSLNLRHGSEVLLEIMPDLSLKLYIGDERRLELQMEEELIVNRDIVEISSIKLIASYVAGYDRIIITCSDCSTVDLEEFVKLAIEKTIGLEVVEKDRNIVVFQCLANISTLSFPEVLKMITKLISKSFEDIEKFLNGDKTVEIREVLNRDNLIDKFYLYGLRQLNQVLLGKINYTSIGLKSMAHVMYLAMMLKLLERTADHLSDLGEDLAKFNINAPEIRRKLINYVTLLRNAYTKIINYLLFRQKLDELDSLNYLVNELKELESGVIKDLVLLEREIKVHLIRIVAYLRDLIELLIDTYELDKLIMES